MPLIHKHRTDKGHPIWDVFTLVKDNLERLIVLNLCWSLQLLPGFLAVAFSSWPLWLRMLLFMCTCTLLVSSAGMFYGIARAVCAFEPLTSDVIIDLWPSSFIRSLRVLAPLYASWGLCLLLALFALLSNFLLLQVLIYYIFLILIFCSFYWGPIFADDPQASPQIIFKRSWFLIWRYPAATFVSALLIVIVFAIGIVSVVGLLLITPVLCAMLQTRRYQIIREKESAKRLSL